MSLRLRVILLVISVLLASGLLGAFVVGYEVRKELGAELAAGMAGARQTAAGTFEDLPRSDHPARDLRQLIQAFDGNRHVRVILVGAEGRTLMASRPSEVAPSPPAWFRGLLQVESSASVLSVPVKLATAPLSLLLIPTPEPDVHAAWAEGLSLAIVIGGVSIIGLVLLWLAIGAGLRPLRQLAEQFARIGAGDYSKAVSVSGPPELGALQRGCNHMTEELAGTMRRNRQLGEQLTRLQEEERAEIARDLHDEIGPRLFAVGLDAAMIVKLCEAGRICEASERAQETQRAIAYMQGQVRDLLGWLRPARLTEFGLLAAIEDLAGFWRARRQDVVFRLDLREGDIPEGVAEIVYRIVQEAVNNAMRHANPSTIAITVRRNDDISLSVTIENDGSTEIEPGSGRIGGLGLIGMRERVEANGGMLDYGMNASRTGWEVRALLRPPEEPPVHPGEEARP